jgi:CspA family cold shock protein
MNRINGEVRWFDPARGYGFLIPEVGDDDIFVHHTGIGVGKPGRRNLEKGAKVSFEVAVRDGRNHAFNVMPLEVQAAR